MNCESFRKLIAEAGLTPRMACKLAAALVLEDQANERSELTPGLFDGERPVFNQSYVESLIDAINEAVSRGHCIRKS